jgi:hypothetical protein
MCMMIRAAFFSAASVIISGSARPPVTSLMIDAPASSAPSATAALVVSIEINAETFSRNFAITGTTRASSSFAETGMAPGRVDSPPTSIIPAPSAIIREPCSIAFSFVKNSPPSEKESGVTLSTPMIRAFWERSTERPAIFHSVPAIEDETII